MQPAVCGGGDANPLPKVKFATGASHRKRDCWLVFAVAAIAGAFDARAEGPNAAVHLDDAASAVQSS
jgi:hypothetical protein